MPTMRTCNYESERSWWTLFAASGIATAKADPMARQLDHFCNVIRGKVPPLVSVRDAAQSLRDTGGG
jgi:hypothetical protein